MRPRKARRQGPSEFRAKLVVKRRRTVDHKGNANARDRDPAPCRPLAAHRIAPREAVGGRACVAAAQPRQRSTGARTRHDADRTRAAREGPRGRTGLHRRGLLGRGTGYVQPSVPLGFGARTTGEPNEARLVSTGSEFSRCHSSSDPPRANILGEGHGRKAASVVACAGRATGET